MLLHPNLLCIWGSSCTAPPQLVNHCKWLIFQDLLGIRKDKIRKIKALICTIVAGGFPCFSDKDRVPRHCNAFTYQFLQHNFVYLGIFYMPKMFFFPFFSFWQGWFWVVFLSLAVKQLFNQSPARSPPAQSLLCPPGAGSSQLRRKMDIACVILRRFDITSLHGLLQRKLFCIVHFITFWDYQCILH